MIKGFLFIGFYNKGYNPLKAGARKASFTDKASFTKKNNCVIFHLQRNVGHLAFTNITSLSSNYKNLVVVSFHLQTIGVVLYRQKLEVVLH